jgi:hypothetical protein
VKPCGQPRRSCRSSRAINGRSRSLLGRSLAALAVIGAANELQYDLVCDRAGTAAAVAATLILAPGLQEAIGLGELLEDARDDLALLRGHVRDAVVEGVAKSRRGGEVAKHELWKLVLGADDERGE